MFPLPKVQVELSSYQQHPAGSNSRPTSTEADALSTTTFTESNKAGIAVKGKNRCKQVLY